MTPYKVFYRRRRSKGLCVSCGAQSAPGHARCAACAEKHRAGAQGNYTDRVERGVCVDCEVPVGASSRCDACRAEVARRTREYRRRLRLRRMDEQAAEGTW